jgi:hypothetical protein
VETGNSQVSKVPEMNSTAVERGSGTGSCQVSKVPEMSSTDVKRGKRIWGLGKEGDLSIF